MNPDLPLADASDELMVFREPAEPQGVARLEAWKVLIVDDEEEVHSVTKLALSNFELHGRRLEYFDAYSGREGVEIMRQQPGIALVLMDVVMESDHAGLDAVQTIRHELGNRFVRIILRTGQPGQAPEQDVVRRFDINDYKEKTELTAKKMYTLMHTGINQYREIVAMDHSRAGLEKVIVASTSIFESQSLAHFAHGVLEQLSALLFAQPNALFVRATGLTATKQNGDLRILAGTGDYTTHEGKMAQDVLAPQVMNQIAAAVQHSGPVIDEHHFVAHFPSKSGVAHVVYLTSGSRFDPADARLVELFCRNVAIAFENLNLHQEIMDSQQQLILMLSAAIEERSKELRSHVRRVSEYSVVLGRLSGFDSDQLDQLRVAAAMHDLGKIAIPEAILNKPGELTEDERSVMETHVRRGLQMLSGQRGTLLGAASIVVGEHHEHWNGGGYPRGLKGEEIHVLGRIVAIADVFDALTTTRCYKEPWNLPRVIEFFREQSGGQFEPKLVDFFLNNLEEFLGIKARLYDVDQPSTS